MLPKQLFWAILLAIWGYALWRGRSDERVAASVCLLASVVTHFVISPIAVRYQGLETGLLLVDAGVLGAFILIALRSERFWPLWVAGLQLTMSMAHFLKAIDVTLLPRAYAAAAVFWSYPILFIIGFGTWRHQRRYHREHGAPAPIV
ncbi:MAG TPA: hypothetical protein VGF26_27215 [Ramlibacter sp.]